LLSLPWWDTSPLVLQSFVPRLNQVLGQLAREPVGSEMIRLLVRRAVAPEAGILGVDGLTVQPERAAATPAALHAFLIALMELTWRLLGTAGTAPLRSLLEDGPTPASENSRGT
jgi:hypothetical protein